MGVIQGGDRAGLAREAVARGRVHGARPGDDLERDRAAEARVERLVDRAHTASADGTRGSSYGPRRAPDVSAIQYRRHCSAGNRGR